MSSQADSFEQILEAYLTCFIKKVIEVIDTDFNDNHDLQAIVSLLNSKSEKVKLNTIAEIFSPENKHVFGIKLKKITLARSLKQQRYDCEDQNIDTDIADALRQIRIIAIEKSQAKLFHDLDNNPDDVDGYAVKIARLFQVMAEADFLDFDPKDEWGQAFKLLTNNQCEFEVNNISKTASSWKKMYYEQCKPLRSIKENNRCLLDQTAHTLGFDPAKWDEIDFLSDNALKECVDAYKRIYLTKKNLDLDFSSFSKYLPKENLTEDEKELLKKLKNIFPNNFFQNTEVFGDELKPMLDDNPSDTFLIKLLELCYQNGYYQEANAYVLDKIISPKILQDIEFNLLKAHIYGSVGKYEEAWKILEGLKIDNTNKLVDIKTSMVSNLIRNYLRKASYNSTLHYHNLTVIIDNQLNIQKRTFEKFVNFYKELFEHSKHYYPGINYAYMYSMYRIAYTDTEPNNIISEINNIYEAAKKSIESDKCNKKNAYYATISEIEFFALMDNDENVEKGFANLSRTEPTTDMLYRTLRQIKLYLDFLKHDHDSSIPSAMQLLEEKLKNTIESSTNR